MKSHTKYYVFDHARSWDKELMRTVHEYCNPGGGELHKRAEPPSSRGSNATRTSFVFPELCTEDRSAFRDTKLRRAARNPRRL